MSWRQICSRLPLETAPASHVAPQKTEYFVNYLLDLALLGHPLASRNNAYLVFLPAWGALINVTVMLFGGRCFFTARAGPDEWHSLFPGWGGFDRSSLSLLQTFFITVATMPQVQAVFEAQFKGLCSYKLHNHP